MKLENPLQVKPFKARRARLAKSLGEGIVVLPTAPERHRNADTHYDYRWDSGFYYLTGFREPEAVLVMLLGAKPRTILFCREKNLEREIWDGFRFGPELARETFGFDEAYPYAELDQRMPELLADRDVLHTPVGSDPSWDLRVAGWLNAVRARVRTGVTAPTQIRDVRAEVNDMRLFKDEHELAVMRRAAQISSAAHVRAMKMAAPGMREYQVEAELLHDFIRNGARAAAYGSIVAAGANACVLHYRENSAELRKGDLMLIDAQGRIYGEAMMFHPPKKFLELFGDMMKVYRGAAGVERRYETELGNGAAAARAARLFAARRERSRAVQPWSLRSA